MYIKDTQYVPQELYNEMHRLGLLDKDILYVIVDETTFYKKQGQKPVSVPSHRPGIFHRLLRFLNWPLFRHRCRHQH